MNTHSLSKVVRATRRVSALVFLTLLFHPPDLTAGGTVLNCTEAALRAALAGGGLVTFACDGTITLGATITNEVDTVLDGSGHQLVLSGSNALPVFHVKSGVRLTIRNLTIANGYGIWGGGIWNSNGIVTLVSVRLRDNVACNEPWQPPSLQAQGGQGGAIYNQGTLNATNCIFSGNAAEQRQSADSVEASSASGYISTPCYGGAIQSSGELNLINCSFEGNKAHASPGHTLTFNYSPVMANAGREAAGGAVYCSGPMTLRFCSFTSNVAQSGWATPAPFSPTDIPTPGLKGTAAHGGAISAVSASIYACSFVSNSVFGGWGGGGGSAYYTAGAAGGQGGSGVGGALSLSGGSILNSTFAWNTASGGGGGGGGGGVTYIHFGTPGGRGGLGRRGARWSPGS